jgi:branched-subunit amino acid transport protein
MSATVWIAIGLLAVGTVAIKSIGPVALGGRDLPPRAAAVVARLAPSLLAALVVVDTFGGTDRTLSVDETLAGLLAAAAALAARLPMIVAVVIAAVVTAGLRAIV